MFKQWNLLLEEKTDNGEAGGGSGSQDQDNIENESSGSKDSQEDQGSGSQGHEGEDFKDLPDFAQKLIKELRAENAKYRTEKNNLSTKMQNFEVGLKKMLGVEGEDDLSPEEKLEAFSQKNEQMAVSNAMLSLAYQNSVSPDQYEYFEFLMGKKLSDLEEGQELSEGDLEEVLGKVRDKSSPASTSTSEGKKGGPSQDSDELSQEDFNKMGIVGRSKLYREKPDLYNKFMKNL